MPNKSLWSVTMIRFLDPRTNILAFSSDHATARTFSSVDEYGHSDGIKKREPANTSLHLTNKLLHSHSKSYNIFEVEGIQSLFCSSLSGDA